MPVANDLSQSSKHGNGFRQFSPYFLVQTERNFSHPPPQESTMRRMIFPLAMLIAIACQPQGGALSDTDAAAIRAVAATLDSATLAQDWDAVFALFTEDAVSMTQGYPTSEGRSAMRAAVDSVMVGVTVTEHAIEFREITGSGDIAYARGTYNEAYVVDGSDQPIAVNGRLLAILRKQLDGSWLIAVWVPISDHPLASPEGDHEDGEEHT
jgi:uncharacterized protein (TIGR02246 family)